MSATGSVRQVASAQTSNAYCTVSYDGSTATCDPLPPSLTVSFNSTLTGSKLFVLATWNTLTWDGSPPYGSMGACTDNLGQNWVGAGGQSVLITPPAGATIAGITSITCQTAFPNVPPTGTGELGVLILHFYEVTGAAASDTVTASNRGCSVLPLRNMVTILADYSGVVSPTYSSNPSLGDTGVLGAASSGSLVSVSDNPSYAIDAALILTTIYASLGDTAATAPLAYPNATSCVTVTVPQTVPGAETGVNLGKCKQCESAAGEPINLTNGNVYIQQRDYAVPGLGGGITLDRIWNSLWPSSPHADAPIVRMFGDSWTSNFEDRIVQVDGLNILDYWRSDGSKVRFTYSGSILNTYYYNQTYPKGLNLNLYFDTSANQYNVYSGDEHVRRYFDSTGSLISIQDIHNNTTNLTYDAQRRLTHVNAAGSQSITFAYDDPVNPNQATSVQDATGAIATYQYDAFGKLTKVTYADASFNSFNYDASGLILRVTDTDGKLLEAHTYDAYRRGLTSERAGGVEKVSVSYDSAGGVSSVTDSLGHVTQYPSTSINQLNQVTSVSGPGCATCGGRGNQSFVYDTLGHRTSSTDALNNTTQFTYETYGSVDTQSNTVDGSTIIWRYAYNSGVISDLPRTVTDPLNNVTTYSYLNGQGQQVNDLQSITGPAMGGRTSPSVTSFTYATNGELLTITDPLLHVTTLTYTTAGMVETVTDAQSKVTKFEYDARGNRTATVDDLNGTLTRRTTFEYDARNRLRFIHYPTTPETTTAFTYDNRGRRTSVTDANNKTTTYAYDDADRLISVTDAQNGVTQYAYDTENHLLSITDALQRVTSFEYDENGRVSKTTFPSTFFETYTYDAVGNLHTKTDRKNQTITYTYDALQRLKTKQYPDGTQVNYTYDLASRLTSVTDPSGTYGYTYDNMGRLTQISTTYAFIPNKTFTVGYAWDAASNLTSMTDPQGGATLYTYDTLNRLSTLKNPQRNQFGFSYDALGRRTQLTRPNAVNTNYAYDVMSRATSILHQITNHGVTTTLDGAEYTYDATGNRLSRTDKRTNVVSGFGYDDLYELTSVAQGANTTESYSYDVAGNRLSSLGVSPYSYDASNHLTSTPSVSYTYDDNGNLQSKTDNSGTTMYTWDFENRLTRVTLPGGAQVNFKYDPMGRRIQKSSVSGTVNYVYDGPNLLEEVDGSGNVTARYTQDQGVDHTLAMLRSGATSYYEVDGLGSVTSLSNSSGALANTYTYDSFGTLSGFSGTVNNPYGFTGRERDSDTGLYYYRARYYSPDNGRFISEDKTRFNADVHFYRYTFNSPTVLVDPSGQASEPPLPPVLHAPCPFNVKGFVDWMNANAKDRSRGMCAQFVRLGLEKGGGLNTTGHPSAAKEYGALLEGLGFMDVTENPNVLPGDIAVFQPANGSSVYGHIQVWNGSEWVSDFKQGPVNPATGRGFYPNVSKYGPQPFVIYRHPCAW